jgi:hypothetical protein
MPYPGYYVNSEVKPPKAGIVLRWVTFLALDFQCTLPPMVHPFIVGGSGELDTYNQPCGNVRGDSVLAGLSTPI